MGAVLTVCRNERPRAPSPKAIVEWNYLADALWGLYDTENTMMIGFAEIVAVKRTLQVPLDVAKREAMIFLHDFGLPGDGLITWSSFRQWLWLRTVGGDVPTAHELDQLLRISNLEQLRYEASEEAADRKANAPLVPRDWVPQFGHADQVMTEVFCASIHTRLRDGSYQEKVRQLVYTAWINPVARQGYADTAHDLTDDTYEIDVHWKDSDGRCTAVTLLERALLYGTRPMPQDYADHRTRDLDVSFFRFNCAPLYPLTIGRHEGRPVVSACIDGQVQVLAQVDFYQRRTAFGYEMVFAELIGQGGRRQALQLRPRGR